MEAGQRRAAGGARKRFRGVWEDKKRRRWKTRIWLAGEGITHLGSFSGEEEAARAYDRVAIAYLGRHQAHTNFPVEEYATEWRELEDLRVPDAIALVKRRARSAKLLRRQQREDSAAAVRARGGEAPGAVVKARPPKL